MPRDRHLVQRLIAFLKRPDSLEQHASAPVRPSLDDYAAPQPLHAPSLPRASAVAVALEELGPAPASTSHSARHASYLDAIVMRVAVQFNAQMACVIARDGDGRLRYRTGRDLQGRFVPHDQARVDASALRRTLDSGESQLFLLPDQRTPALCGPLYHGERLVGVLYLDAPARNRLHRGVFSVLCQQVARMLANDPV